jgi:hypothetical protein
MSVVPSEMFVSWWLSHPCEKYEFVSWDNEIPNIWKKQKMIQTTNQLQY